MAETAPEGYVHTDRDGNKFIKRQGQWVPLKTSPMAPAYEFASGVNRTMGDTADFLTTGPVNAMLDLTGADTRLPTFRQGMEAIGVGRKGFMEPGLGREFVAAAGEWTPAFVNPELARQGARVAREFIRNRHLEGLLQRAAPTVDDLTTRARQAYKVIGEMKTPVPQSSAVADDIIKTLTDEGLDADLTPNAVALTKRIARDVENPMTVSDWERIRRFTDKLQGSESALGSIARRKIDDMYQAISPQVAGQVNLAHRLHQQRKKAEIIEKAIEKAGTYAYGLEAGLQRQFASIHRSIIDKRPGFKGWTEDEIEAVRKVYKGGLLSNALGLLGKLGPLEGGARRLFLPSSGGILSGYIAHKMGADPILTGAVGLGTIAIGQSARMAASQMTQQYSGLASAIARAGPNGRLIASSYLKHVPAKAQNAHDLAALLYSGGVDARAIDALSKSRQALVANAAVLFSIMLDQEEEEQQQQEQQDFPELPAWAQ